MPAAAVRADLETIDVTPDERRTSTLSSPNLSLALAALERDGVVAIAGAVDLAHVDLLAGKMLADLDEFDAGERGPLVSHWQGLRPPPAHPHLHRDVVFNDQVVAVLRAFLGEDIVLTAYGANTACEYTCTVHTMMNSALKMMNSALTIYLQTLLGTRTCSAPTSTTVFPQQCLEFPLKTR